MTVKNRDMKRIPKYHQTKTVSVGGIKHTFRVHDIALKVGLQTLAMNAIEEQIDKYAMQWSFRKGINRNLRPF